jgi:tetratricopeptide (TPR) repeat protein
MVVATLLAAVPLAFAGDANKGTDPAKAAALAHFETAGRLFDVREYGKALEEYKVAYLAKPDPAFLFNIGQCYRKLGQNAQALDFFTQYLKKSPPDDPNRTQVEARIADIRAEEKAKSDPAPAVPVPQVVPLVVAPSASVPVADSAPVAVGAPVAVTSPVEPAIKKQPKRAVRLAGIAGGIVGVAGLATGTVCGLIARSRHDAAMSNVSQNYDKAQSLQGQAQNYVTAANIGFITGGALTVASAVLYFLGAPDEEVATSGTHSHLRPILGPSFAGLNAGGTW